MKKIVYGVFIFLVSSTLVNASNIIYDIDMDIYLDEQGNANITEIWDVKGSDGTEWYKGYGNVGQMQLKDFTVSMDGKELEKSDLWDVNKSLEEKKGYYGVNNTSKGFELCFGKYDYYRHRFTLKYTLTNVIFNTDDSQVLYNTFIDRLSSVKFYDFHIKISSYYSFSDDLDVWGYGYKGYAYVKDSVIEASNDSLMNNNYVVLLVKFPVGTFNTEVNYEQYKTFNDVYTKAEKNTIKYDYSKKNDYNNTNNNDNMYIILVILIGLAYGAFLVIKKYVVNFFNKEEEIAYRYKNNKVINRDKVPFFRDIPCDKDIYYANSLIYLNDDVFIFCHKENILGAILLKWVKEDKIKIIKEGKNGIFSEEKISLDLTKKVKFDNELEEKLFNMMYDISEDNDGILKKRVFDRWARRNYEEFLDLFEEISKFKIIELEKNGHILESEYSDIRIMDDTLYDETVKLYGLKRFLEEFSKIDTKEVIEVKLWDEYLMFAYLFGIADRVAKQLKNLYPEIEQEFKKVNFDYDTLELIDIISRSSAESATTARYNAKNRWSDADSYSSGGGGFSSGGGGGGSFGSGGGGGSR